MAGEGSRLETNTTDDVEGSTCKLDVCVAETAAMGGATGGGAGVP